MKNTGNMDFLGIPVQYIEMYNKYKKLARQKKWQKARHHVGLAIFALITAVLWLISCVLNREAPQLLVVMVWVVNAILQTAIAFNKARYSDADVNAEIKTARRDAAVEARMTAEKVVQLSKEFSKPGYDEFDLGYIKDASDILNDFLKQMNTATSNTVSQPVQTALSTTPATSTAKSVSQGVSLRKPSNASSGGGGYITSNGMGNFILPANRIKMCRNRLSSSKIDPNLNPQPRLGIFARN